MLTLTLLEGTFTLHRLGPNTEIPTSALHSPFFAIVRTDDETSLVLPDSVQIGSDRSDTGWACFKVEGSLEFSLVGILAGIASVLAEAKVSIFALSTFDTDYILVKREQVRAAKEALRTAGYKVNES
ncbi:MAG: ACT domain-containing protein [Anaerolineales bacterium]|nr:ACT domain-containing protein [Anaerolineales bacterium]